jgi:sterol desaturase/sphingolipid hydroxylase (fatty acid hydroxylase superfamily)
MTFQESLFLAIPGFVLLMLIERAVGAWKKMDIYSNIPDVISSLSSGMANVTMASIGIGVGLVSYEWMLENFAIFQFDYHSPLVWFLVIVGLDFGGYWGHRLSHQFNLLWQTHIVHHSSEEFNLPCALRQTVSGHIVKFFTILGLPMAVLGIPMEIIAVVALVHLYYQYWYHTQLIGNLGWLERIIVTPEQHGIHHAMNPEYIDKNFGQWFSIWDQLFGTFQLKIDGVEPVYGVTRPVQTWNPIKIDFMHWFLMLKDMLRTKSLSDKLKVLVSRTNWRPEDVNQEFPVEKIADVNHFKKYKPEISRPVFILSHVELIVSLALVLMYFWSFEGTSEQSKILFGGFILFNIYVYTSMMEGERALGLSLSRLLVFLTGALFFSVDWFFMSSLSSLIFPSLLAFFATSAVLSYFYNGEREMTTVNANNLSLRA